MSYGVQSTGFVRKPLATILAEIEASNITEFGPNVIQTPQSPLGQLNGLFANFAAQLWELGEDIYQSYDPDQAEGTRLDTLAKIRLLRRAEDEEERDFRQAITNSGRARIDVQDIVRAIRNIAGVTYAHVFVNETSDVDENGLLPGSLCVAVLGGNDDEIADTMRTYVVPGISTYGNTYVSSNIDGFCRTQTILRPILVPVTLNIKVRAKKDALGCPPPSVVGIRDTLIATFRSTLINGDDITHFRIRSVIESAFPNVEVISFSGEKDGQQITDTDVGIPMGFVELATFETDSVVVDAI